MKRYFFCGILNIDPEKAEEIACLTEHYLEGKAASRFFNMIDFLYESRTDENGVLIPEKKLTEAERRNLLRRKRFPKR